MDSSVKKYCFDSNKEYDNIITISGVFRLIIVNFRGIGTMAKKITKSQIKKWLKSLEGQKKLTEARKKADKLRDEFRKSRQIEPSFLDRQMTI